jgi:membrane dipeptidase
MDRSESPVIFSHSNARNLFDHERNILDEQIKACAAGDGVIGVTGVGLFLGKNGADPRHVLEHIDYLCQLVGPRHVGIGLDSVLNHQDVEGIGEVEPFYWPARQYPSGLQLTGSQGFVPPETFPGLVQGMLGRGYNDDDIGGILGGNFARLARQIWKPV